jgi:hypothetical protein
MAMTGLYWIIQRRMALQAEQAGEKSDGKTEPEE